MSFLYFAIGFSGSIRSGHFRTMYADANPAIGSIKRRMYENGAHALIHSPAMARCDPRYDLDWGAIRINTNKKSAGRTNIFDPSASRGGSTGMPTPFLQESAEAYIALFG